MNTYFLGFHCTLCDETYAPDEVRYTCPKDGGNLDAVYDYPKMARELDPRAIVSDPDRSIWHYAPLLPTTINAVPITRHESRVTSHESRSTLHTPLTSFGWSPLYRAPVLESELDMRAIWLKDDGRLPSASFKDRASATVIARGMEIGVETICVASTGNAAAALACLCAGTPIQAVIFVPENTPEGKLAGILIHGANVFMVRGSYNDAVDMARQASDRFGWYNRSTGYNAYTREGKKTAAYEIAEQLARYGQGGTGTTHLATLSLVHPIPFKAPDVVIVPVGDGNIISGLHKGFKDLHALGWIDKVPRFIGVTATLAPSLYRAWQAGKESFEVIPSKTIASGISVNSPCDGVMALRAVRETGGCMIEATDEEMLGAIGELARKAGVFVEPASAAAYVGLVKARHSGVIRSDDEVVLQLTGSGLKDTRSALQAASQPTLISLLDEVWMTDDGR